MKGIYTTFLFLFCTTTWLSAQVNMGCDGTRYLEDVFTDIKKTTVVYGENTNALGSPQTLRMDIYEPENEIDGVEQRPAIILAFGGSFIFGQREDMADFCIAFAKKGYVAVTIDYRLFPLILGFPDSTQIIDEVAKAVGDMKAAVRHLRKDAATDNTFKINPDYIFVGGYSAGAIAATHTAYLDESDDVPDYVMTALDANGGFEGDTGDASNLSYSSEVAGVLSLSGGLLMKEWIQAGEVPLTSYHGTSDVTVPYNFGLANNIMHINGSGVLHQQAEAVGLTHYLETVDGGGHSNIHFDAAYQSNAESFYENALTIFHSLFCTDFVSVEPVDVSQSISVAPNPSTDVMTFDFEDISTNYDVRVYDQLGRLVHTSVRQSGSNFILEKQKIGKGFFFVNILFEDSGFAPVTKRVIFE